MGPQSRFPSVRPAGLGSVPQSPTEELCFVQDRLALLGKLTFFISGMFLVGSRGRGCHSSLHSRRISPPFPSPNLMSGEQTRRTVVADLAERVTHDQKHTA